MDLDLIYMNSAKEDVGIMKDFTLDLAYGDSENNFECKIVDKQHCCKEGWFLYIENTEYGGIIDDIAVNSAKGVVTYLGRTWHGILNSKIIQPDNDADYLVVSGEANSVIATLINRIGVNSLFKAVADNSGITITNYRMHRYISGYDGIVKMLKSVNAKLNMKFNGSYIELSVKPIIDYSKDEQFDTDQIALIIKKKYNKLNHVICLGKGELSNREIIHIYADENGNIVENQVFTGLDEVETVYENVNVTGDELRKGGIDKIKAAWSSDELDFKFNNNEENYDIGDIVGGSEHITGTEVAREITKKIVNISNNTVTVSYPSDTGSGGSTYTSSGSGGESGGGVAVPKIAYNLLDNSDFRNPVNQRGVTSYTPSSMSYCLIDRWAFYGTGAQFNITENNISANNSGSATCGIVQVLSGVISEGKTYTLACKANVTGKVYMSWGNTRTANTGSKELEYGVDKIHTYTFTPTASTDGLYNVCIRASAVASTINVEWMALYEGEYTAETLPEYMPKGYAHELAECQRYFERKKNKDNGGFYGFGCGFIQTATQFSGLVNMKPKRATPSITTYGKFRIRGTKTYEVTNISANQFGTDTFFVNATITGASAEIGQGALLQANNDTSTYIDISADL